MSYDILRRELKQGVTRRLYLFYGPEDYLVRYYSAEIEKLVVEPHSKDVSYSLFEGKTDPEPVYGACGSYPMSGGRKLVVLNNCGLFKRTAEDGGAAGGDRQKKEKRITFEHIIGNIPDFACLLIIEREVDKRVSLFKQISANGLAVEFTYRTPYELEDWARAVAGRDGRQFTRDALRQFVAYNGESMTRLKTELDKLLMYTAEKKGVTASDVNAVCTVPLNAKIFDLLDNALAGQKKLALSQLDLLLRDREPPMRIFTALSNHIALLRHIKYLAEKGMKLRDATKLLGLNPYRAEKLWRQSARLSPQSLSVAAETCLAQDLAVKRGVIGDASALYNLVAQI